MYLAIEITAVLITALSVYLSVKENIWSWPTAIAGVLLFVAVFFHSKLYADMSLQFIYAAISIYGWYEWLHGGSNKSVLKVSSASTTTLVIGAIITAIAILPIGYMFQRYTDASLPFADSSLVAFSLFAQFLMAKKYIENWYFWILVDVFYVPLYSYKQLYPTAALYLAFIPLCVAGLMEWRKSMALAFSGRS